MALSQQNANKPFTWQRIKMYPATGDTVRSDGSIANVANGIDTFNQLKTVEYSPIIELKPYPNVDFVRNVIVGTESNVSVVNGEIQIDGTLEPMALYTRKTGRYLPGLIAMAGLGIRIPNKEVGHYEFGYGDDQTRFGVQLSGGQWTTYIQKLGNRYYVRPREEWIDPLDGTGPSGVALDLTEAIIRIQFGWYGYLSVEWQIAYADRDGGDKTIVFDRSGRDGTITGASIDQPDLPLFAEADGGVMYVGGRQFGVYGRYNPEFRVTSTPVETDTVAAGAYTPICSVRLKSTRDWLYTSVKLAGVTIIANGDIDYAVYVHDVANLDVATFGAMPETDDSTTALQYASDSTTFSDVGAFKLYGDITAVSGAGQTVSVDAKNLPDIDFPNDLVVTLVARGVGATPDVTAIMQFKEEW